MKIREREIANTLRDSNDSSNKSLQNVEPNGVNMLAWNLDDAYRSSDSLLYYGRRR